MEWSSLILAIVAALGAFRCYSFFKDSESLKYAGFSCSLLIVALTQLAETIESLITPDFTIFAAVIVEWGHILSLAVVLGALASFIRDSKPDFAQFPKAYIGLPLLIVISYFLVKDTYAIKDWLISIYQGGAILVALLMYSVYTYRNQDYAVILGGISIFLVTFFVFWYIPAVRQNLSWIWKLLISSGIIVTVLGYSRLGLFAEPKQRAQLD